MLGKYITARVLRRYIRHVARQLIKELDIMSSVDNLNAVVAAEQATDTLILNYLTAQATQIATLQAAVAASGTQDAAIIAATDAIAAENARLTAALPQAPAAPVAA